ncbi:MAG: hypothetical protein H0W25_05510, partial [Acidimicrobiia bacterium]|nr:hypothetical protein [Acidimicrobiia bacterium]
MIEKKATKSGEPRYEVRVRGTDGTERSKTFRIKKEAERYERAQQTAVAGGVWIDPRAGRVTLAAWSAEWQRTVVHLSPSTQRIYEANLRLHVMPELGEMELSKLTPSMLRAWLSGVSTKTRCCRQRCLHMAWRRCVFTGRHESMSTGCGLSVAGEFGDGLLGA